MLLLELEVVHAANSTVVGVPAGTVARAGDEIVVGHRVPSQTSLTLLNEEPSQLT
jgi:hypothetical protein